MAPERETEAEMFERERIKDRMRRAGMAEVQADAVAEVMLESFFRERLEWERRAELATKKDFGAMQSQLESAIGGVEQRVEKRLEDLGLASSASKVEVNQARDSLRELIRVSKEEVLKEIVRKESLDEMLRRIEAELRAEMAKTAKEITAFVSAEKFSTLRWVFGMLIVVGATVAIGIYNKV